MPRLRNKNLIRTTVFYHARDWNRPRELANELGESATVLIRREMRKLVRTLEREAPGAGA